MFNVVLTMGRSNLMRGDALFFCRRHIRKTRRPRGQGFYFNFIPGLILTFLKSHMTLAFLCSKLISTHYQTPKEEARDKIDRPQHIRACIMIEW